MGYKDYIPTKQSGGFLEGTIFDSTNPFWYNAYQYVPRDYVGLDVDNNLRLILERSKKKTPEMPDLSKFKEKLDKDLLYAEKSILLDRFNTLERAIREELQYNPYALSNNPTIIGYFNELVTMYNSAELQSQIDKKNEVVKQIAKARESGQQESYVKDSQTGEYIPVSMGKLAQAFVNSQGMENRYNSMVFGNYTPGKGYENIDFSNVGKGTEKDFTDKMLEVYSKVETNSSKEGGRRGYISYVDAFGQPTHPAYATGYIKTVAGGYDRTESNLANLAETTSIFRKKDGEFSSLLGDKAQEGFNQLVVKALNGSSFTNQLSNVLGVLSKAKEEAEKIAKKNNIALGKTTFDTASEKTSKLLEDENLKQALSQVSSQKLIYDLSVLRSNKNNNVKSLVIKSNPVLSLLLSKENGNETLQTLEQLLNLVKITTQEGIINSNTNFNTVINQQTHTDTETYSNQTVSDGAYGGGNIEKQKQAYTTKYAEIINGYAEKEDLKEKEMGLDEYIIELKRAMPNLNEQRVKDLAIREAAANDYLYNTKDGKVTGMEQIVKGLLQGKSKDEIINDVFNAVKQEGFTFDSNTKKYIKVVGEKTLTIDVEKAKNDILRNMEIADKNIKLRIEKYSTNPEGFAIKVKRTNAIPASIGDTYSSRINPNLEPDKELEGGVFQDKDIYINNVKVPEEALKYITIRNVSDNAQLTQIPSVTLGSNLNISSANHPVTIDIETLKADVDKLGNKELTKFYEAIEQQRNNGALKEETIKDKTVFKGTVNVPISKNRRDLSANPTIKEFGIPGADPRYTFPYREDATNNTYNKMNSDLRDALKAKYILDRIAK